MAAPARHLSCRPVLLFPRRHPVGQHRDTDLEHDERLSVAKRNIVVLRAPGIGTLVPMSWSRRLLVGALLMSTTVAAPMAGEAGMAPGAERCFSVGGRGSAHDIALLNLTPVNA